MKTSACERPRRVHWPAASCLLAALLAACAAPTAASAPVHDALVAQDAAAADLEPADVAQPDATSPAAADGAAAPADSALTDSESLDAAPADAAADAVAADLTPVDAAPADAAAPPTVVWLHHPAAAELTLRGNAPPLSWDTDTLPTDVQGTAARFVLDGNGPWQVKALHKGAWALGNNHVPTPHQDHHLYPYFDAETGAQKRENYDLPGPDGSPRTLRALLPPGYAENTVAHYPLLLMLDGQNLFEDETASFGVSWKLGEAVQASMAAAKLGEIVTIGVDHAGVKRILEYTPWYDAKEKVGGGGEAFLVWVDETLLPDAAVRYRLIDDRKQRTIGGSSLGALMALYALVSRTTTWGNAICMSGAWWWDGMHMVNWLPTEWNAALPVRVWLDAGTVNDELPDTQAMKVLLQKQGLSVPQTLGYYEAKGAQHSESFWAQRVHLALEFLLDPGTLSKPF